MSHSVNQFRSKFWISLLLAIPVVVYSGTIQNLLHFAPPAFFGSGYIPLIFSTILFFYGGLVFIRGAVRELHNRSPGMMVLIALAITVAYTYSLATQFFLPGDNFFWELATLIVIMLLGHWLEMAAVGRAENALESINKLLPDTAEKLVNGQPQRVAASSLQVGDLILVRPGTSIAADGVITDGQSTVDESAISGESRPVSKKPGSTAIAGTINQDGALTVRVTKLSGDTVLAGIMRLVAEAQTSKSKTQILADKAAFWLTIFAIATAAITFFVWLAIGGIAPALQRSVTVLVIACPHALGLAIPLVVAISTALAVKNGLLIRRRAALETARNLGLVLFDKTGTLTKGEHAVTEVWASPGTESEDILRLAASLEQTSEHIIGRAIVKKAAEAGSKLQKVANFVSLPGVGVKGEIGGQTYVLANPAYLSEHKLEAPPGFDRPGQTVVYLIKTNIVIGALALADEVREESKAAIQALKQLGLKTAMITGDSAQVASQVAKQLGLDDFFAEVKPADKSAKVKQLQASQTVAMVGDGVNDAPALMQADIGIAISAGTDIAIESADIILIKNDPRDVVKIITLSKATYRKMLQNLAWATSYNVVTIPLAAGVLQGVGVVLSPAAGAILMSISTIIVALNAQLLRRKL